MFNGYMPKINIYVMSNTVRKCQLLEHIVCHYMNYISKYTSQLFLLFIIILVAYSVFPQ